jgi:hypothetical protein
MMNTEQHLNGLTDEYIPCKLTFSFWDMEKVGGMKLYDFKLELFDMVHI